MDSKLTMTDQPKSETGNPSRDDKPKQDLDRPGLSSSQQAGSSDLQDKQRVLQNGPSNPPDDPATTPFNPYKDPNLKVCPYNLTGMCRHGDKCWYSHSHRNSEANTDSNITRHSTTICPRHRIRLQDAGPQRSLDPTKWAQAPEFVPQAWKDLKESLKSINGENSPILCPKLVMEGKCPFSASACPYFHGDTCELCRLPCLDPKDEAQREAHVEKCQKELVKDMDYSFAIQRSKDNTCGICHDVVWEKEPPMERKFGILENCNHIYCLACIRKWRQIRRPSANDPDQMLPPMDTRLCPECRVHSDFFVPSHVWVEGEEDKLKLIREYKEACAKKPCKYFKADSTCPLVDKCFFLHSESIRSLQMLPRRREDAANELALREALWESSNSREDSEETREDSQDTIENFQETLEDFQESLGELQETIGEFQETLDNFQETLDNFQESRDETMETALETLDNFQETLDNLQESHDESLEATEAPLETWEEAMGFWVDEHYEENSYEDS